MWKKLSIWWHWTGRGIAMFLFFVTFFVAALFASADYFSRTSCLNYGEGTGTPVRYVKHNCYVQRGGQWYDREEIVVRR